MYRHVIGLTWPYRPPAVIFTSRESQLAGRLIIIIIIIASHEDEMNDKYNDK